MGSPSPPWPPSRPASPPASRSSRSASTSLEAVSYALPLTYAFDALDRVASGAAFGGRGWLDVAMIVAVTLLALALGAFTLRRRTP
jgi:hypothetical protein